MGISKVQVCLVLVEAKKLLTPLPNGSCIGCVHTFPSVVQASTTPDRDILVEGNGSSACLVVEVSISLDCKFPSAASGRMLSLQVVSNGFFWGLVDARFNI